MKYPARGIMSVAPGKDRSETNGMQPGDRVPPIKSPEAVNGVRNENVFEGQRMESLMRYFVVLAKLSISHLCSFWLGPTRGFVTRTAPERTMSKAYLREFRGALSYEK